jgi:hypothetical protein
MDLTMQRAALLHLDHPGQVCDAPDIKSGIPARNRAECARLARFSFAQVGSPTERNDTLHRNVTQILPLSHDSSIVVVYSSSIVG